ncbi:DNA replication terminus site-binding protein [Erwinia oleae]|uniref:DNA replication terminus site-binding protein n=1 Tax=Erwinia oleae TaxID=796334 RepID=UPI000555573B|nr:DNA replication terminus site-binding protein [Erwinia oleae]
MSRHDAIDRLHRCVADLETSLSALCDRLQEQRLFAARVFELPAINKGNEHEPVNQIAVEQHLAQPALDRTLKHFTRLFIHHQSETISTKAAVRLPGVICVEAAPQAFMAIHQITESINNLKKRLEEIITIESGVASEERFEFVHTHIPGLITLNAYRSITLLDAPDSVRFGWANKHIIKKVSHKEILHNLEKSIAAGRSVAPWSREQWAEKLEEEMAAIKSLPASAVLRIKRPVKVQPIARVWNKQQQKQTQFACPSPLIALCPDAGSVPKIGELLNYDQTKVTYRYKPDAKPLYPIVPRLHLYSDRLI